MGEREGTIAGLNFQVGALTKERNALTTRVSQLETANQQLKGEVPDRVYAIAREDNISQLYELVIGPARRGWACGGSAYFGDAFWSFDWDRRASDGSCY